MKITSDCINHNVARLINDITENIYDCLDDTACMNQVRIEILGEIRGIMMLADALKEVLNS